jgi:colicin import membrane protein
MKPGMTISCIGHAAALICAVLAISAQPMETPPVDSLPVSFISDKDFTKMTQGAKNAPQLKIDMPKPLADKVDAPKAVDQLAPKVVDKPAITTDTSKPKSEPKPDVKADTKPKADPKPDPKPEAKADPKPDPKPEAKADPKPDPKPQPEKPKTPEYKPDQIADILKKDAAKDQPKPDNTPQKTQNTPKFDANQVAALLDKREPQRQLASAETLNPNATLGAATGAPAAQLSQSEIDALRARLTQCWNPPAGVDANTRIHVSLRVLLKQDGSLLQPPVVVEGSPSALGPALAESAQRALLVCQPFTMLRPEHYDQWKDLQLDFDPRVMLGG